MRMLGIGISPHDVSLTLRGIDTMAVRLPHSSRVALELTREIEGRGEVAAMLHLALPSFPQYDLWRRDFAGASGAFGIILEAGREVALDAALNRLRVLAIGASYGGTLSLVVPTRIGPTRTYPTREHDRAIFRFSIGLEDQEDLRADLWILFDTLAGDGCR